MVRYEREGSKYLQRLLPARRKSPPSSPGSARSRRKLDVSWSPSNFLFMKSHSLKAWGEDAAVSSFGTRVGADGTPVESPASSQRKNSARESVGV